MKISLLDTSVIVDKLPPRYVNHFAILKVNLNLLENLSEHSV